MIEAEKVVIEPRAIPSDDLMFTGLSMEKSPVFSVGEVAKTFLAQNADWVRWREKCGATTSSDGKLVYGRTRAGARKFNLAEIEELLHALAHHDAIDGHHLLEGLGVLRAVGILHGFLVVES